ncbi:MAG: esterase-like activity of phytase family protein [Novosphingobium sp.]
MPKLGAFRLEGTWQLRSCEAGFGGYSALLTQPGGMLLGITDRGSTLRFSPPGVPRIGPPVFAPVMPWGVMLRTRNDSESATADPATGRIWIGFETTNAIARLDPGRPRPPFVQPPAMAAWPENMGAEAMVRLVDGQFIVLREGFGELDDGGILGGREHEALLFPGDPIEGAVPIRFRFVGPGGFRPVDMAQLPDGRVLILMRKLVWPLPIRVAGRIVIADPRAIQAGADWRGTVVARLASDMPIDNFEGLATTPGENGRLTVWLISDANKAVTQRTLLWKLSVDPKALP